MFIQKIYFPREMSKLGTNCYLFVIFLADLVAKVNELRTHHATTSVHAMVCFTFSQKDYQYNSSKSEAA